MRRMPSTTPSGLSILLKIYKKHTENIYFAYTIDKSSFICDNVLTTPIFEFTKSLQDSN